MKAALDALDQLNAIAWQHADALDSVPAQQPQQAGQHTSMQRSASLDKLKRSLSMPDQITRDLAKPLLASALDEVLSGCESYVLIHVLLAMLCCAADARHKPVLQMAQVRHACVATTVYLMLKERFCLHTIALALTCCQPVVCPLTTEYTASCASWCQVTHCNQDPHEPARLERLVNTGCSVTAGAWRTACGLVPGAAV